MNATTWIIATLVCIGIQSFYSMIEMAIVSFNKVRLHYYVAKGIRRARWIEYLLERPIRLFGTTLIGVNLALQVGSQCSREVYSHFHLNPDIAPITQVFLVMIFAELAPMFAARRHVEHVAMLGIPFIYISSKFFIPAIWVLNQITRCVNFLFRGPSGSALSSLSREELQLIVEAQEDQGDAFNVLVANIFTFRRKTAFDAMTPLAKLTMLPAHATVKEMCRTLVKHDVPVIPLYEGERHNIVGITLPRDGIDQLPDTLLKSVSHAPWFITKTTSLMEILKQFRHNNQTVAIVLDREGLAIGLIILEDILEEIFGPVPHPRRKGRHLLERTLPGSMLLKEFNAQFETDLGHGDLSDLADLVADQLGHLPEKGDTLRIADLEIVVVETTLLGAKTLSVTTIA
ncbi:MAG: HlyC/CorC family transporter [Verrucomicrobia bacterium]|nr:HlyC/CorC family transporter [Verrucomicrobiota bacterium]